jgi:aspartate/methionine/tyrosine aminotransferase
MRRGCQNFKPEIADMEGLLEQGTKVICLTNLHNPSATLLGDDDQRAILETAKEYDSMVLVDEIYREMTYSSPPRSIAQLGDNGIASSGLTKMFGLRGLRIGWLLGPKDLMENVEILRIYLSNHLPAPSLHYAIEALKRREWFRERALRIGRRNLRVLEEWLEQERRISYRPPDGGLMALLNLPQGMNDIKLGEILVEKYRTAIGPGSFFGAPGSIRVTFSVDPERFESGLRNISSALNDLRT